MKGWRLAYFAFCAHTFGLFCAVKNCFEVSADLATAPPALAGLDAALAFTANLENAHLYLLLAAVPFTIKNPAIIHSQVDIQGGGGVIVFSTSLQIRGTLAITNSTVTSNLIEGSVISLKNGTLYIKSSSIGELRAALASGSGKVKLEGSILAKNSEPAVSIEAGGINVQILNCSVWNHTGEILRIQSVDNSAEVLSIVIDHSVIRHNRGPGYLFTFSAPLLAGSITISSTEFAWNAIPQLYFDISAVKVAIRNCFIHNNSGDSLTVYASETTFNIENSLWAGHSGIVFDFRQFTGNLLAVGVTVKHQLLKGIFLIMNTLASDRCRFTLQNSSFLDSYSEASELPEGVMNAIGCIVLISQSVVKNVRIYEIVHVNLGGLIAVRAGELRISKLVLRSSGASDVGIGMQVGSVSISDCVLDDLQSGARVHVGVVYGSLSLNNITFTHPARFTLSQESLIFSMSYYFGAMSSNFWLRSTQVLPGSGGFDRGYVVVLEYCNFNISELLIKDLNIDTAASISWSGGSMSNVTIINCILQYAMFSVINKAPLQITGLTATNCLIGWEARGIFGPSSSLNINCSDFYFHKVAARCLISSASGQVYMRNVTIDSCRFDYFVNNEVATNITFEKFIVHGSTGGLAILFRSSLHWMDSVIENLSSKAYMLGGESANITLERIVISGFSNPLSLSRLKDSSQLLITNSKLINYQSLADEGFDIDSGTVTIEDTHFISFNVALIQSRNCKVSIRNSVFQTVSNKVLSKKTYAAYGSVLGCLDCPSVTIESSLFLNVSAVFGGAVAVRSEAEPTLLQILDSEFVMCSATAGGAVYIQSSSFLIESSRFISNKAVSTGGAVDVNTYSGLQASIRNCSFYRNSAKEGGAVKWWESQVSFVNVTFQDNSAVYGPSIASFGVRVTGSYTFLTGEKGSGYPLQVTFELQDHYNQRVQTAFGYDMELQSSDLISYRGNRATIIDQGAFNFPRLTVYTQPNSSQRVSGVVSYVKNGKMKTLNGSIDIEFRDCVPGEVRKADRCEYCFPGNISFDPSDAECSFCPVHGFCPGGNVLLVNSHYWRSSNRTTLLIACPMKGSCVGGLERECASGYKGEVCMQCAEDYTRFRVLECAHCSHRVIEWIKVSLSIFPILGFSVAVRTTSGNGLFALKQFVNHVQLLSALSYIRVSYPTLMKNFLYGFSYVSSLFVTELPVACFVEGQGEYIKAIVGSAISPILLILLFISHRTKTKERIILCTSALMFTPMISLYTQMPLLICQSMDLSVERLLLDMEQKCWEGFHLLIVRALVLPSVILNVLLPILLVSMISISAPEKFRTYFPLWSSGLNWCSWDMLHYCVKVALISALAISVVSQELCQVTYGLIVLILASVAASAVGPYAFCHWKCVFLVESSFVVVAVSLGLSARFIYSPSTDGVTDWIVSAVFLVLNFGYFIICVSIWRTQIDLSKRKDPTSVLDSTDVIAPPNSIEIFDPNQ